MTYVLLKWAFVCYALLLGVQIKRMTLTANQFASGKHSFVLFIY